MKFTSSKVAKIARSHGGQTGEHGNNDFFYGKCGKHRFVLFKWLDFWLADICYIFLYSCSPSARAELSKWNRTRS